MFGRAVTELRTTRNVSQVGLAEALNYSSNYVNQLEQGKVNFSCAVQEAIAGYFKMSIGNLWTYAEKLAKTRA